MTTTPRYRPSEIENEVDEKGYFHRQKNRFTASFGESANQNPIESGRYRLIWAETCHWSNRAAIVIELLGLEKAISVNKVGINSGFSREKSLGWEFIYDENHQDPVLGVQYLSELYYNADPNYQGRPTVPALVDITTKKVVNNDYTWLTNYLERDFKAFHKAHAPDLYPEHLRQQIDEFNNFLFDNVNNAVYKAMFAQSIDAYNDAYNSLYCALDLIEQRLETKRFLFGDFVTDADIRLFVTLARFDAGYAKNLGPLRNRIVDFKNIWGYARDLYEIPAFKHNTYFKTFAKKQGDRSGVFIDYYTRFWDKIDYEALWSEPHQRQTLSQTPDEKFIY
ncbi:glutathione S-transferase C-terminal domain-containing protein [Lonepinella koalarum]|uniref:glutathione S-transferase C-terminal domain-containing protein n=1 Tax=Lonepinella koalarum TaxID=53417 RepID=UPI003F6E345A